MSRSEQLRADILKARSDIRAILASEDRSEDQKHQLSTLTETLDRLETDLGLEIRLEASERDEAKRAAEAKAREEDSEKKEDPEAKEDKPSEAEDPPMQKEDPEDRAAGAGQPEGLRRAADASPGPRNMGLAGEAREHMRMLERASMTSYVDAIVRSQPLGYATVEREMQQSLRLDETQVPWGVFLTRDQMAQVRADAATVAPADVQQMQKPIIGRVFARSAVDYLGITIDAVPVGDSLYHVITAGQSPTFEAPGSTKEAVAGTLAPHTFHGKRLSAGYLLQYEDLARVKGMEDALRGDLQGSMSDALDSNVLNGSSSNTGSIVGILRSLGAVPGAPAAVDTFATGAGRLTNGVDGKFAHVTKDLKALVNPHAHNGFAALIASNTAMSLTAYLQRELGGFRSSANMPVASNSGVSTAILGRTGAGDGAINAVCPIWSTGVGLIRDNASVAASGQIRITALALHDFGVLRRDAFALRRVWVANS